jgi:hypothetical protein
MFSVFGIAFEHAVTVEEIASRKAAAQSPSLHFAKVRRYIPLGS